MFQAHGFDAWLAPRYKSGAAYDVIRHLSGLPSRLFLLLVGVAVAIRIERQIAKGTSPQAMRAQIAGRGLAVLGLAYLFRLQEHVLAGFQGGWEMLFRVDILNCIGAAMLVVALISTPTRGQPRILASLLAAAFFLALGPIIGPARFPTFLPRPLTSYLGGQRPMAWFSLFPWCAWAFAGVAIGHTWLRFGKDAAGQRRVFLLSGIVGALMLAGVTIIRRINPHIIRYPSELVQQMGPGTFFYRLGMIGLLATLAWAVTRVCRTRFSPMRQLGQTSLLVYWIHVDLCYGGVSRWLRSSLDIPRATLSVTVLSALMLGISLLKTRFCTPALPCLRGHSRPLPNPARPNVHT